MSQPPKRWWTDSQVAENPGKVPQVNSGGDGFEFVTPGGGGGSYLVYTALITQIGAAINNITANVLENTLGTVTWSRTGVGVYRLSSAGLFTVNKTFLPQFGITDGLFGAGITLYGNNQLPFGCLEAEIIDASIIEFSAKFNVFPLDGSSFHDDLFNEISPASLPIEIRVYP